MPSRTLSRTPVGVVVVAWRVWRRLPPEARRSVVRAARAHGLRLGVRVAQRHGPRVANGVLRRVAASRSSGSGPARS